MLGQAGVEHPYRRQRIQMASKKAPAKVISITSGKGGVGKTHTTVNLGLALVKQGKRVLILDADLGLANVNILLGFKPGATINDLISGEAKLKDVIVNHPSGLDIIPASSGVTDLLDLDEEQRMVLLEAVEEFGSQYDYLLIDTAAGIGQTVMYFNVAAEEVLVVIGPEPTSITDAYALIKVLSTQHGVREFSVVVNRAPVGSDGRAVFAQLSAVTSRFLQVSLNYRGPIAEDSSVVEAVVKQKPYLDLFPSAKCSRDISKLAEKISSDQGPRTPKGGLQFFFKSLLEAGTGSHTAIDE